MGVDNPAERTLNAQTVSRFGSYAGLSLLIAVGLPFIFVWYGGIDDWLATWPNNLLYQIAYLGLLFGGFVIGIGLHEVIHGLTWSILVEKGWKHIRFGIFRPSGTPYCYLTKPVELRCYMMGLLMPGILTGLGPLLIGFWQGSGLLLLWGVFLTQSATGDVMMAYQLWGEPKGTLIQDQSEQLGYWAYPPDQGSA